MRQKPNRLNALKHGAFAETAFLPGEAPREFDELYSALIEEWVPVGASEEDAVLSLAKGVWRKRRLQKFIQSEVYRCKLNPNHSAYNEHIALKMYSAVIAVAPDAAFDWAANCLSSDTFRHLNNKFYPENFESESAWIQAIQNEIASVLLPKAERLGPADPSLMGEAASIMTSDLFKLELALDERIDAMMDRAIKRLVQTKAMKQMLNNASSTGGVVQGSGSNHSAKVINHKQKAAGT